MPICNGFSTSKCLALASLLAAGLALAPVAEAQARGTLQASATVVDTRPGFAALEAAREIAHYWASRRTTSSSAVSTVAQISITRRHDLVDQPALVVTIDYLRN